MIVSNLTGIKKDSITAVNYKKGFNRKKTVIDVINSTLFTTGYLTKRDTLYILFKVLLKN